MLPSRPVRPPSLQGKIPAAVRCRTADDKAAGKCSALELLAHNPDFSIFVSMLRLADLIDILSLPGPITVFAPTNEAFDGLPTPLFKVLHQHLLIQDHYLVHVSVSAVPAQRVAVDPVETHDQGEHPVRQLPAGLDPAGDRGGGEVDRDDIPAASDHL